MYANDVGEWALCGEVTEVYGVDNLLPYVFSSLPNRD